MRFPPVARFIAASLLFAGWIGWLIFLAVTSRKPVVLSRPQLLVSEIDVLAEVDALDKPVNIKEVLFARIKDEDVKPGATLTIANLRDCKRLPRGQERWDAVPLDWTGPGVYLLPLQTTDGHTYGVTTTPSSPGYPPRDLDETGRPDADRGKGTPRIYPLNEELLRQYREFRGTR